MRMGEKENVVEIEDHLLKIVRPLYRYYTGYTSDALSIEILHTGAIE